MRKSVVLLVAGVVFAFAQPATAGLIGVGASLYGGLNIPVAQSDAGSGSVWGFRVPVQAVSMLRFEPFVSFIKNGDYTIDDVLGGPFTYGGGKMTGFGLNAMFGAPMTVPAVGIAFVAGIGSYKLENDEAIPPVDESRVGYSLGVDVTVGLGPVPVALDGRADFLIVPLEDGGSRKNVLLTIGAVYKFGL